MVVSSVDLELEPKPSAARDRAMTAERDRLVKEVEALRVHLRQSDEELDKVWTERAEQEKALRKVADQATHNSERAEAQLRELRLLFTQREAVITALETRLACREVRGDEQVIERQLRETRWTHNLCACYRLPFSGLSSRVQS